MWSLSTLYELNTVCARSMPNSDGARVVPLWQSSWRQGRTSLSVSFQSTGCHNFAQSQLCAKARAIMTTLISLTVDAEDWGAPQSVIQPSCSSLCAQSWGSPRATQPNTTFQRLIEESSKAMGNIACASF